MEGKTIEATEYMKVAASPVLCQCCGNDCSGRQITISQITDFKTQTLLVICPPCFADGIRYAAEQARQERER
jgi:uncharacterized protein CbrC (UPF0167 family)